MNEKIRLQLTDADVNELNDALRRSAEFVSEGLGAFLTSGPDYAELAEAERYSALSGGKRVRPFLLLETCRMLGGDVDKALPLAVGLEMVHTYSLIHDDLPCMDNDDIRRGKPTNHKVFGETTALLAGDALLTDAFYSISSAKISPSSALEAVKVLSRAAGTHGMVGGQYMDLHFSAQSTMEELLRLQSMKTGALIEAAVEMGIIAAGVPCDENAKNKLLRYARKIGLAFQIADDILDGDTTENSTFLRFYSAEQAREKVKELTKEAVLALDGMENADVLSRFAVFLAMRKN